MKVLSMLAGWSVLLLCVVQPTLMGQQPAPAESRPAAYVLATEDQIFVSVLDLEEIKDERPLRVDSQGNIRLPLVGLVHVAGLTIDETETAIRKKLGSILQNPEVTVILAESRKSDPVSVLGAVKSPGLVPMVGTKTLTEVLATAGGASQDAGNSILITRRKEYGPLPLPNANLDSTGHFYIGQVNLKSLTEAKNPQENIVMLPQDVISVPKGELVYVVGAVPRAGGFVLNERETITVLQAISLAGGLDRFANQKNTKILRPKNGFANPEEITVDVKSLLEGKTSDVPLQANDILFVPVSGTKAATVRTVEALIGIGSSIGTGAAIYRR